MSQRDRVAIFPSRANLVMMKHRITAATRGLNLLKRKRDALDIKLRELASDLRKAKQHIDNVMEDAIFAMTKARFLDTDFKPAAVMEPERADVFMRIRNHKVAGLLLPTFDLYAYASQCFPLTGLSRGGEQVEVVRRKFQDAVKALITFASLEFAVKVLEDGVRQNNMRINGLDYVVIPRFANTVNYIRDELEEYEREDFYRLKRSQAKQRKIKEAFAQMLWERTHGDDAPKKPKQLGYGTNQEFDLDEFTAAKEQKSVKSLVSYTSVQDDAPKTDDDTSEKPQEDEEPVETTEAQTQTDDPEPDESQP